MITKSMVGLIFSSVLIFGNAVLSIDKLNSIECKIVKNNNKDVDCTKKGTYSLDIGDEIISSLKKNDFKISYHTTDSVFVLETENGYKIDKSLLSWLSSLYDNIKNPNVNDGNGGTLGAKVAISSLPSYTKVYYGQEIKIRLLSTEKGVKYELEDNLENIIKLPKILNNTIVINSKDLVKSRRYALDIWNENTNQTISIEFLKGREEEIYKQYLGLSKEDKEKYREALFNEFDLKLK